MQNDQKSKAYAVVFRFVKENLWLFGLGLLCSMLNTAFNSLTPQIIRMTVDSIIGSEELPGWFTALGLQRLLQGDTARVLLLAAAAVLAAAILSGVFSFLARINTARASENAIKSLRDALYGHIQKLPFSCTPPTRPARSSSAAPRTSRSSATLSARRWWRCSASSF